MASQYVRLLDATSLSASKESPLDKILDLGAYTQLNCQLKLIKMGTGGTIKIYHSATNEPDSFLSTGASWDLNTGTGAFIQITGFLRYIKWVTDTNVTGSPVVLIDIIAKE